MRESKNQSSVHPVRNTGELLLSNPRFSYLHFMPVSRIPVYALECFAMYVTYARVSSREYIAEEKYQE